jgi:hypothetical protein
MTRRSRVRYAGVLLLAGVVLLSLLPWAIARIAHSSWWSVGQAIIIGLCGGYLGKLIRDRVTRGAVVLDSEAEPWRYGLAVIGAFYLAIVLYFMVMLHATSALSLSAGAALAIFLGVHAVLSGLGRLQFCARGIWRYEHLLPWRQITAYRWHEATLLLTVRGPWIFSHELAIPLPPEQTEIVEAVLGEHLSLDAPTPPPPLTAVLPPSSP